MFTCKLLTVRSYSGIDTLLNAARCVDIIRATETRGLLVINFNRISARAIVTSSSMADINRARVSDPRLYYHRYRVAPAFMMISMSRTVPLCKPWQRRFD
ncbi:hypothetical protein PUN28_003998 [Cardiocondyla obscurior]|uniref:Uncharacterized protein n=1 Tax=Cardiocondyla obscurior TaxID=286306 RepID=A0AAW2GL82_9HYME